MTFETISQAYNSLKNLPITAIESRAQAINAEIASNPNADLTSFGIELEALERILEEKQAKPEQRENPTPDGIEHTAANTADVVDLAAKPEYRSAFFRYMQGRELSSAEQSAFEAVNAEVRNSEFNTLSNAAAVIPTKTLDQILVKARDMGGFLADARTFSVPANVKIPIAAPGQAASWHTEGAAVDTEKVSPTYVQFGAYELMRVLSISAATRTMSISAFESYLTDELSASIMAALYKGAIDGDGSGEATGVLTGITWVKTGTGQNNVEVAADATLDFADILKAVSLLKRGYQSGAKFFMNQTTLLNDVYSLHDDNNRPIFLPDLVNGTPGRVLGRNVVLDDFIPDGTIVYGNAQHYGVNLPAGIMLDMSTQSSFAKGLIDYRGLAIADAKPIFSNAFVKISKAAA